MLRGLPIFIVAFVCGACGPTSDLAPPPPQAYALNSTKPNVDELRSDASVCVVPGFLASLSADLRGPPIREMELQKIGQCVLIVNFNEEIRTGWNLDPVTSTFSTEKCIIDVVRLQDGTTRAVAYAIRSKINSADNCLLRMLLVRAGKPEMLMTKDSDLFAAIGGEPEQVLREVWMEVRNQSN